MAWHDFLLTTDDEYRFTCGLGVGRLLALAVGSGRPVQQVIYNSTLMFNLPPNPVSIILRNVDIRTSLEARSILDIYVRFTFSFSANCC